MRKETRTILCKLAKLHTILSINKMMAEVVRLVQSSQTWILSEGHYVRVLYVLIAILTANCRRELKNFLDMIGLAYCLLTSTDINRNDRFYKLWISLLAFEVFKQHKTSNRNTLIRHNAVNQTIHSTWRIYQVTSHKWKIKFFPFTCKNSDYIKVVR